MPAPIELYYLAVGADLGHITLLSGESRNRNLLRRWEVDEVCA
jgi:hypothetical protein